MLPKSRQARDFFGSSSVSAPAAGYTHSHTDRDTHDTGGQDTGRSLVHTCGGRVHGVRVFCGAAVARRPWTLDAARAARRAREGTRAGRRGRSNRGVISRCVHGCVEVASWGAGRPASRLSAARARLRPPSAPHLRPRSPSRLAATGAGSRSRGSLVSQSFNYICLACSRANACERHRTEARCVHAVWRPPAGVARCIGRQRASKMGSEAPRGCGTVVQTPGGHGG